MRVRFQNDCIKTKKIRKALTLRNFHAERQGFEPRVPRSTTVFKTAAIDHSATSPKLRNALAKHFLSKAMQRYDLFSKSQTF